MHNTIYKWSLKIQDKQTLHIPADSNWLDVQVQQGQPCIWARVDGDSKLITVTIRTFGTGHDLPNVAMSYLGTYQTHDGELIWHVYQEHA